MYAPVLFGLRAKNPLLDQVLQQVRGWHYNEQVRWWSDAVQLVRVVEFGSGAACCQRNDCILHVEDGCSFIAQ
jgi:hypothetical protein